MGSQPPPPPNLPHRGVIPPPRRTDVLPCCAEGQPCRMAKAPVPHRSNYSGGSDSSRRNEGSIRGVGNKNEQGKRRGQSHGGSDGSNVVDAAGQRGERAQQAAVPSPRPLPRPPLPDRPPAPDHCRRWCEVENT